MTLTIGLATDTEATEGTSRPVESESCWNQEADDPRGRPAPRTPSRRDGLRPLGCGGSRPPASSASPTARREPGEGTEGRGPHGEAPAVRNMSSAAQTAPMTRIEATQSDPGASFTPAAGSPTRRTPRADDDDGRARHLAHSGRLIREEIAKRQRQITVVTSNGWTIETRPRSSAAPCRTTPTTCAARPSSHTHRVRRIASDFGWRNETPVRPSEAFCQSVAARAKQRAARSLSAAANPFMRAPGPSTPRWEDGVSQPVFGPITALSSRGMATRPKRLRTQVTVLRS